MPHTYAALNGIYEISIEVPQKTKNRAYGLAIPFLGLYPKDSKSTHDGKNIYSSMLSVALVPADKTWSQPKCLSTDK